ncbi:MAG: TIM barrel protein [Planctomycetota bacterium]|nr:TIM barrel protein [Planctomycetota bacterium]MDA1138838.1 TIM barrel protein [Planctomycetota bacterium]
MQLTLSGRIVETASGSAVSIAEFVQMAADNGYESIDLRYSQLGPDHTEAQLAEVESALAGSGIKVALMNAGGIANDDSLAALSRVADAAERLNCEIIRISGPIEMMRKSADLVAPRGMRLCSQIHTGGEYETIASTKETLDAVGRENFGVIAEPANLLLAKQPYTGDSFAEIIDSVFGVNIQSIVLVSPEEGGALKLRDGTEVHYSRVPLGENSQLDTQGFFDGLKGLGFKGFVNVLEPFHANEDSAQVAGHSAAVLRRHIG